MKKIVISAILLFSIYTHSQNITTESFATGFSRPVVITNAGDSRLFIVEQGGLIKILNSNGTTNASPFIDLSNRLESPVTRENEQGLLGLAFHPNYSSNGFFYVYYTDPNDDSVIDRYERNSSDPNLGNINTRLEILRFSQPFTNHNGGNLIFGPDNKLYISSGDGGSGGDPGDRAQNINLLLGKILRLDIDQPSPYIPSDNPFVGVPGADEVWAYGLRNPWKFSFDSLTDDLWIADVGQQDIEEVNKTPGSTTGVNYGWRCYEGSTSFNQTGDCPANSNELTFPVSEYSHTNDGLFKCSVTGGYVYRGTTYPAMQGKYIFADYCSNEICMIENSGGSITYFTGVSGAGFATFGEDINKELYVAGRDNGVVYKVIDDNVLNISENDFPSLSIYPNPTDNNITIDFNKKISSIAIYDLKGKLIQQETINPKDQHIIDVSFLSSGFYIVKITDINQNNFNQKLTIK
ncbi:PQQ-dependent sugar dehydrogenase [Aquimarina sp. 2201CG5-10]|uniref:PQQ-dependent sugar dehydrogenase n=1 Tax=Aquimarina callyspongiae TaxID=3098150 RepID=UPI002AB43F1D|nr:PQQ-dependent sugar dehydrogenase [Aquimarina sp. 2201CG5-10]MDY8138288.1 PQQ-dependent sugar dehydrogenase [Aquimarina sp. 2201CG5-10]